MKILILILFTFCIGFCFSQDNDDKDFVVQKQFYLKGNSTLIGNNILNYHKNKPLNDYTKINDLEVLEYVDIDNNNSTFNSSQATLTIPENSKVKYAALYWSAIYPYSKGKTEIQKLKDNIQQIVYVGDDQRDTDFNKVQFKTPNNNYIPIEGTIVFDGLNSKTLKDTKPYVCFADVTSIVQISGDYTLANVKATQGLAPGGCAGGWLLYVIYENLNEPPKYFSTYNGFLDVFKDPKDITFKNFKAPEAGAVNNSILLASLEGDQKFKTDNCSFLGADNKTYYPLFNTTRPRLNFFNSTITIDNSPFLNRVPASTNTMGFDLLKMKIPNQNNFVIANNAMQATVSFSSKADRFYLFFVAFETEISPIFLEGKENTEHVLVLNNTKKTKGSNGFSKSVKTDENKEIVDSESIEKIKNLKSITIPNLPKGYYLVTNAFSIKDNATKWIEFLKSKGHSPKYFINPVNDWNYIYLNIDLDPYVIYEHQKELSKIDYFEDIWILKINF